MNKDLVGPYSSTHKRYYLYYVQILRIPNDPCIFFYIQELQWEFRILYLIHRSKN